MFAKTIIDSDAFLDMPATAQLLYFHLSMRADDDGFVNKPKTIMRMCGSRDDDLKLLFVKKFLIPFDNGIVVIKHWKIHNYISKDRYTETKYKEEKALLTLDENKSYTLCIQDVYKPSTQVRLGKDSIGKDNNICAFPEEIHESEDEFFERIWKLYPIKKGKGQVSKTKKQVLRRIGYEEISRCVERYVTEMTENKKDKQYWQHGSTFFNSGYVDYLDKNYCTEEEIKPTPISKPEPEPVMDLWGDDDEYDV